MFFSMWIGAAKSGCELPKGSQARMTRATVHSFRPQVERLEDRALLDAHPHPINPFLDAILYTPLTASDTPLAVQLKAHLRIVINGQEQVIAGNIGQEGTLGNLPIHTTDDTGTITVASVVKQDFHLQDFFAVFGQQFSSQNILGNQVDSAHTLTMTVNGKPSTDFGNLVLHDQDNIIILFGQSLPAE